MSARAIPAEVYVLIPVNPEEWRASFFRQADVVEHLFHVDDRITEVLCYSDGGPACDVTEDVARAYFLALIERGSIFDGTDPLPRFITDTLDAEEICELTRAEPINPNERASSYADAMEA